MKRVLILLFIVLVVGCNNRGPDSDWECRSCHWGVGEKALECPNCGVAFESKPLITPSGMIEGGIVPVRRKK